MRTRKNYKEPSINKTILMFIEMLNTIKLYHWETREYSVHKATDQLYSDLNDNIDKYVESLLGKKPTRANLNSCKKINLYAFNNFSLFKKQIEKYKNFLIEIDYSPQDSDLVSIRDEILSNLNQFTYLLSFK